MKKCKKILFITFLAFILSNCGQKDYDRIIEVGNVGVGVIDRVEDTNVTVNNDPKVRIYVTVYSLQEEPYEAVITSVVSRVAIPRAGDRIAVKNDPEDKQKIIWVLETDITQEVQQEIDKISSKIQ